MGQNDALSWEEFLSPEVLRTKLISTSLFLTVFQMLKECIIQRIWDFLTRRVNNILSHPDLAPDDRYLLIALQLVNFLSRMPLGTTITLAFPGWPRLILPALNAAQRARWAGLPTTSQGRRYRSPLSNFLQGVLNPVFFAPSAGAGGAPGPPPRWTWPIVP